MKAKQENHLMKVKPYSMFRHSFSRTIKHVHQHRLPCTKEIIFLSLLHSYERTNKQTNKLQAHTTSNSQHKTR
jgi:hypothetical protein